MLSVLIYIISKAKMNHQESILLPNVSKTLSAAIITSLRERFNDPELSGPRVETDAEAEVRLAKYEEEKAVHYAKVQARMAKKKAKKCLEERRIEEEFIEDAKRIAATTSKFGRSWLRDMLPDALGDRYEPANSDSVVELFSEVTPEIMCALFLANGVVVFALIAEGASAYRDRGFYGCRGCYCYRATVVASTGEQSSEFLERCTDSLEAVPLGQSELEEKSWIDEPTYTAEVARRRKRCVDHYNLKFGMVERLCDDLTSLIPRWWPV